MKDLSKMTIPQLREYKIKILDELKEAQRIGHKIDKEIKNRLKIGEINE